MFSVRNPPTSGPMTNARPKTAPKRPWYLPRSAGVNMSPITASATGKSEPAPMPWSPRKKISIPMFWLRPESADPRRKITMPVMKTGLRPKRSESLPQNGTLIVLVSR
jgi:hypothetical protein